MRKLIILFFSVFYVLNIYSQKVNYYQESTTGEDNLNAISNLGKSSSSGWAHAFDSRYEGIKGTPDLFHAFVPSFLLTSGQEKYIQFESDLDLLKNTVMFIDPSTGKLMEISSDNVAELIFVKYDNEFIYKTTKGMKFDKKIREIYEGPYRLIMIPFKTFIKADYEPAFNSGRHYDEYRSERKFYLEDSKGIFHHVILNKIDYNCLVHPTQLDKKAMAKLFPDKKELIYKEFEEKPDSVSVERIISILKKFRT
jgi:hypothetical protein